MSWNVAWQISQFFDGGKEFLFFDEIDIPFKLIMGWLNQVSDSHLIQYQDDGGFPITAASWRQTWNDIIFIIFHYILLK